MSASPIDPAPDWLRAWAAAGLQPTEALSRFDACDPAEPADLIGTWRGATLRTGHPLDGLLETLGWYGKRFETAERVHPLIFSDGGPPVALDPAFLPSGLALRLPGLARSAPLRAAFRASWPLLRARRPGARIEMRPFRGRTGAAMVYLRQPITDHFRRAGPDRLLGCMERRGMERPFFFLLFRGTGRPSERGRPDQTAAMAPSPAAPRTVA
jgi:hypothetical protein